MNRHGIFSALGIVLSLAIAFIGWILVNTLLDRQETRLLAAGSFNDSSTNAETAAVNAEVKLEEAVMAKILRNWNTQGSYARPHEPVKGQLNMEQAITEAKNGLAYLSRKGVIPKDILEEGFVRTKASLLENVQTMDKVKSKIKDKEELSPEYSYWNIKFDNEKIDIMVTLNAVTGKMWSVDINSYQVIDMFNNQDLRNLIEIYADYLGLEGGDTLNVSDNMASKGFAGDIIRIVAVKKSKIIQSSTTKKVSYEVVDYNGISLALQ